MIRRRKLENSTFLYILSSTFIILLNNLAARLLYRKFVFTLRSVSNFRLIFDSLSVIKFP